MLRSRLVPLRPSALVVPALLGATLLGACQDKDAIRADSLAAVTAEQVQLMDQLAAQKDSLTTVVLDADKFIGQIDSTIAKVKGLPAARRRQAMESPVQEQIQQRKELLTRVEALVERAQTTARQLDAARRRERALRGETTELKAQAEKDQQMIAQLGETIQRQTVQITELQGRVDSLTTETVRVREEMRTLGSRHYQAYYIIGTEKDLLEKGIVQREGGANLLVARIGRTLQPARTLDPAHFTPIDQRDIAEIQVPDSTKRYRIVSRQSLDDAAVAERDKATFRGNLRIVNTDQFWKPSRYLILVEL